MKLSIFAVAITAVNARLNTNSNSRDSININQQNKILEPLYPQGNNYGVDEERDLYEHDAGRMVRAAEMEVVTEEVEVVHHDMSKNNLFYGDGTEKVEVDQFRAAEFRAVEYGYSGFGAGVEDVDGTTSKTIVVEDVVILSPEGGDAEGVVDGMIIEEDMAMSRLSRNEEDTSGGSINVYGMPVPETETP